MKAWDIYTGDIFGPHPVVLVSSQARIDAKPQVVVLKCTSMKAGQEREPKATKPYSMLKMGWTGRRFADAIYCSRSINRP